MNTKRIFVSSLAVLALLGACEEGRRKRNHDDLPSLCAAKCECEQCDDAAMEQCRTAEGVLEDQAEQAKCTNELESYVECGSENDGQCVNGAYTVASSCNAQAGAFLACLGGAGCPTTNNGVCDEPSTCPVGSDAADCGSSACPTANNGVCDEPNACPVGSDTADCGSSGCPTTNNGVCNEPEGTNTCPEGTDVIDCSTPVCDDEATCSDCQDCAIQGGCMDEVTVCLDNADCIGLYTCSSTCANSCQSDADPQACFDTCYQGPSGCTAAYANGVSDYEVVLACVFVDECPTICN